jgi:acetoin utilization deacetylase AcuC-like enzyme
LICYSILFCSCVAVRSIPPSDALLEAVHSPRYLALLRDTSSGAPEATSAFLAQGGSQARQWAGEGLASAEPDLYVSRHSYAAAEASAAAAIGACDAVWSGRHCAMLCYAVLCYAVLFYAMLCYAMLCYAMMCCVMLYYDSHVYAMLF